MRCIALGLFVISSGLPQLQFRSTQFPQQEVDFTVYDAVVLDFSQLVLADSSGAPSDLKSMWPLLFDSEVRLSFSLRDPPKIIPAPAHHPAALLAHLVERALVRGACDPTAESQRTSTLTTITPPWRVAAVHCQGDVSGPVIQLSGILYDTSDTAVVSILLYVMADPHSSTIFPFAMEYKYRLSRKAAGWRVLARSLTMIT